MRHGNGFYFGNAAVDQVRSSGWFIGQFVATEFGLRHQTDVELKWGVHADGDTRASPLARTAIVRPPALRAPRCAAESTPLARPEITVSPTLASEPASRSAIRTPYGVLRRDPTRAMASWSAGSSDPRT